MRRNKKIRPIAVAASLAFSATAAMAATTPYDLIRPTWPLSWDAKVFENFDTTITKKTGMLPKDATPASFKAGALLPDTLNQAYYDAINTKISPIRVNQAGYLKSDTERQFYYVGSKATEFEVVDVDGKSLSTKVTGTFTATETETQSDWAIIAGTDAATNDQKRYKVEITGPSGKIFVGKIPQSVPTDKRLRIKVGDEISSTFIVSDNVYTMAKDAALKFLGIQRSGNSESWFHAASHTKDGAGKVVNIVTNATPELTSKEGALQGGWYDAGDHLKESQTQAFAFMALAVMSATNPAKDVDHYAYNHAEFVKTDGIPDVLREAAHGADFFLKAYKLANGVIDDMPVSIGNFGSDHSWWGRPEAQDYLNVEHRGGPAERDVRLGELGSNISGEIAAGLAILSKEYANYDKDFAKACLTVAEKMYDFAKNLAQGKDKYDGDKSFVNNKTAAGWATPAYVGNNEFEDDLALASVALLYATGKKEYADDMIRAKDLFKSQATGTGAGFFEGGWFSTTEKGMLKNAKNTSWANAHTYALYALYKLILADKTKATTDYGLSEEERLAAIEDCLADMIYNLGDVSDGTASIVLPTGDVGFKGNTIKYDPTWYTMQTDQAWIFNHYQLGNIFDVLAYADVAADIEKQKITLPTMASTGLKASEMLQLGINQLNYLFGVNPWDISFVYGVGDKNDAHPHHRASNPEGKSTPGFSYKYSVPTGGLIGWQSPANTSKDDDSKMDWENFYTSEATLNAAALLTSALTFVSNGGSDYYEKKCDNCDSTERSPFSGEIYATAYHYTFGDMDFFNINLFNETLEDADSLVAYIYFEATEEEMNACGVLLDLDICQAYDVAGFNKPCENVDELRSSMRNQKAIKVEDTYNKDKKTYTWEQAINLGTIGLGRRMRLDIGVSSGMSSGGQCDILMQHSKVNVGDGWSFTTHTATKDAPAYAGAPDWEKDRGDLQQAPQDPYIVLRSKGKLLWGYGPGNTTSDRVGFMKSIAIAKARMQVAKNKLYVLASAQGTKTVKIFDMLGNQLMAKDFYGTRAEVNLAKLPHRGALIARVVQNDKVLATQSIMVK
ncbi:glycoside hydrolase family 9 protein [Fibrobacter sp. UWB10]|uniref:glycoside hydrolase family 9 protein n=1 Tax=Fibrobacter sp. UWB10 TaxID=1896201 RepID=UPI0024034613|nr:glycoside hydrolase family 9 protein [Fibrobacter sp. UWB10]SMP41304.1 Glycosyl hydrolase family 9 [Fibrobacter sp. UWB10]